MSFNFANVLVFFLVGAGFVLVSLTIQSILSPNIVKSKEKKAIYECGEEAIGDAWFNFNPRFYIVALIFILFDVEIAFVYPVAAVFKRWVEEGRGGIAFLEIFLFVAILALGLAYVWIKGDLEWVKRLKGDRFGQKRY
jgi:NADH-quinone oxidoreductase subunit A